MQISLGAKNFLREAAGWLAVCGIVFGGVYYFTDIRSLTHTLLSSTVQPASTSDTQDEHVTLATTSGEVHLHAADNGHFFSQVDVNGRSINVVVDTGATGVSLTYEDARDIGLRLSDSDFTMESQTANGTARIAPILLDKVQIGDIEVRDVEAFVAERGKLFQTLLGMSFLRRLSHIDIKGQELVLSQ